MKKVHLWAILYECTLRMHEQFMTFVRVEIDLLDMLEFETNGHKGVHETGLVSPGPALFMTS